jgi:hypothetical protein
MSDAVNAHLPFSNYAGASLSFSGLALNDSDNAIAAIFQAKNTEAITHIGVRHTSTTGTSPTYKASIQGVNASGQPDGTIKGGGSPASKTFSPSSLGWAAASWNWLALDNSYTPTRGENLALNITYDSGVVSGSLFSNLAYYIADPALGKPYPIDFQSAWTKRTGLPILSYKTATRAYGLPMQSTASTTFQSGSSPNEYALRFSLPSGWGTSYQIAGIRLLCGLPPASTYTVTLYDGGGASDTTVIQSLSSDDGDFSGSGNRPQEFLFSDSSLATLTFGSTYRIGLRAGGAVNTTIYYGDVAANSDLSAWPLGVDCYTSTRAGGNWTDVTTRRLFGELIFSDITGSGGGTSSSLILPSIGQTGMRVF